LKLNLFLMTCSVGLVLGLAVMAGAQQTGEASAHTKKIQAGVLQQLPFADQKDFADAQRGFIAPLPDGGVIRAQDGTPVWDLSGFSFIQAGAAAPDTVNPSLWR
jgi:alkyl sulfatase BDS1-like metallo-beta-lactamase superfamily hydrolase